MLSINQDFSLDYRGDLLFQYIKCYQSTEIVQDLKTCLKLISIHQMLSINGYIRKLEVTYNRFQYIKCYQSTTFIAITVWYGLKFQYIKCYQST